MASNDLDLINELEQLQQEHLDLNHIIDDPLQHENLDPITLLRLKKRKLFLKDRIKKLKSLLYPNIIA